MKKSKNRGLAVLAYLLAPIPYFFYKDDKFVRFHAKQGIRLFVLDIIYIVGAYLLIKTTRYEVSCLRFGFVYRCGEYAIPRTVKLLLVVFGLVIICLTAMGITNAINGKKNKLPFIGSIFKTTN